MNEPTWNDVIQFADASPDFTSQEASLIASDEPLPFDLAARLVAAFNARGEGCGELPG